MFSSVPTAKYFRYLSKSSRNQSENGKYNVISVWFDKIRKRFLCVYTKEQLPKYITSLTYIYYNYIYFNIYWISYIYIYIYYICVYFIIYHISYIYIYINMFIYIASTYITPIYSTYIYTYNIYTSPLHSRGKVLLEYRTFFLQNRFIY